LAWTGTAPELPLKLAASAGAATLRTNRVCKVMYGMSFSCCHFLRIPYEGRAIQSMADADGPNSGEHPDFEY
jgi:hypothetical protein